MRLQNAVASRYAAVVVCVLLVLPFRSGGAEPLRLAVASDLHKGLTQFDVPSAMAQIIDALQDEDYVGVWALSAEENQLQPISSGQDRKQIASRLEGVRQTANSRELLVTIDLIMNHVNLTFVESGLGGSRVLVLLSGGPTTGGTQPSDVIELLRPTGVQVHAILMGSSPPEEAKAMAQTTNGRIYLAAEPEQLQSAVSALVANLARIRQKQPLPMTAADRTPDAANAAENVAPEKVSPEDTLGDNANQGSIGTDSTEETDADTLQAAEGSVRSGKPATVATPNEIRKVEEDPGVLSEESLEFEESNGQKSSDGVETSDALPSKSTGSSSWVWWLTSGFGLLVILCIGVVVGRHRRSESLSPSVSVDPISSQAPADPNFDHYFSGSSSNNKKTSWESVDFEPITVGDRFSITSKTLVTRVGRHEDNDIVLTQSGISGQHAILEWRDGQCFVVDKGSTNGTYVDDVRVTESLLEAGQVVRFDSLAFRISGVVGVQPHQSANADIVRGDDRTMVLRPDDPMLQELIPETDEDAGDKTSMLDVDEVSMIYHQHCLRHTNRIAHTVCGICTRPYCSECLIEVKGELVCTKCRTAGYG